jgi:TolA-binding protein
MILRAFFLLCLFSVLPANARIQGDSELAFAEHLYDEGEVSAAMIEFRRFLFQFPGHPEAPEAMFQMSRLFIDHKEDIPSARRYLEKLLSDYPANEVSQSARTFLHFMNANADFKGRPLILWLGAKTAVNRQQFAVAANKYREAYIQFPRAKLAPDALYRHASLLLTELKKVDDAEIAFQSLIKNYRGNALVPDAELGLAAVDDARKRPEHILVAGYKRVIDQYPKSDAARQAQARIKELQENKNVVRRQFHSDDVLRHRVVSVQQEGGRYVVMIEVGTGVAAPAVKATLEEALLKHYTNRSQPAHHVHVRAYHNYPFTEAGKVTWVPGEDPHYQMPQRRNEDVLKDVLLDIFK